MGQAYKYADLYSQYLPRILGYIRLRVGDEDLAEDLTAEVFERAFVRQNTLRHPRAFGAWLFAIARTTVAGHFRRERPTLPLEAAEGQAAGNPSPPEALARREELARLTDALAALPERDQEVIRLKFVGGLGNAEIGDVLSLRAGHVAVLLYRALRKVRSHLEEDDGIQQVLGRPREP